MNVAYGLDWIRISTREMDLETTEQPKTRQKTSRVVTSTGRDLHCISSPLLLYSLEVLAQLAWYLHVVHRVEAVVRRLLQPTLC